MKFSEKCVFLPKSNFSSDLTEADMDLVYFVVKITGVKNASIFNHGLSLVRITLRFVIHSPAYSHSDRTKRLNIVFDSSGSRLINRARLFSFPDNATSYLLIIQSN